MFKKILIANRGEIACRIIRTARRMGIATVAVYSDADADADAPHVEMADESVLLGPAPAVESYLKGEAIVEAARRTGAEAVHPGYGFLSENAGFAEMLTAAGIVFIGPSAETIRVMGDKIVSRRCAQEAGVATVPGHDAAVADAREAMEVAEKIGYPVMIKAAAGGGGKGMRVARNAGEMEEGFARATGEAQSGFGDARVFVEKFIESPRHIEIQILADSLGNVVHLGERECSVQRRHQKVIEESPSPFLDKATRDAMSAQAILLAKAVNYCSAGTVEFIVAPDKSFYFLEMNTRLQVEHPVTELVTGLDIVEEMIKTARGEPLGVKQESVTATGWAIEGRIYAEDPRRGFLPSSGRLVRYRPPPEHCRADSVLRNDGGVREGGGIPVHYDPMIAKLCAWGPDRPAAIKTLLDALDGFRLEGVGHNIPFLSAVLEEERFCSGDISTDFIQEQWPDGFSGVAADEERLMMLESLAVFMDRAERRRAGQVSGRLKSCQIPDEVVVSIDGESRRVRCEGADHLDVCRLDEGREVSRVRVESDWHPGMAMVAAVVDSVSRLVQMDRLAEGFLLSYRGTRVHAIVRTVRGAELAARMPESSGAGESRHLICPMPGLVVMIAVAAGQEVVSGDTLAVVEAMKMENVLRAERPGRVARVLCEVGQSLAVNDIMVEFE